MESKELEKIDKRAKSIVAMELVKKVDDYFVISSPSLRGKQDQSQVRRNEVGKVVCSCDEFLKQIAKDQNSGFRCEHILAVKYFLVDSQNKETKKKEMAKPDYITEVIPDKIPEKHLEEAAPIGFYVNTSLKLTDTRIDYNNGIAIFQDVIHIKENCPYKEKVITELFKILNSSSDIEFPQNPIAKSLSDLVTEKQLGLIRSICRENNIDPDEECQNLMKCNIDELSKKAASSLIQYLQK